VKTVPRPLAVSLGLLLSVGVARLIPGEPDTAKVLTGRSAIVTSSGVNPGTLRKITFADLPKPFMTQSSTLRSQIAPRPAGALPQAPPGFRVSLFADGLRMPRVIRVAPNGDIFVAETQAGQVRVFRGITADGKARETQVFASGFHEQYGIVFYPPGKNPQWIYVANTDSVVRYAYKSGDMKASKKPETVIASLPSSRGRDEVAWRAYDAAVAAGKPVPDHGHWTRDLALSLDGKRLFVGVGSASNLDDPDDHPSETHRADILEYTPVSNTPEARFVKVYASGIRNPSGIAVDPFTGQLWCSVNERDGMGDDLPPDYISHVEEGGFYGWPWYYLGAHPDSRLQGKHPELQNKVIAPDVLLQPHTASLQMSFYDGTNFPAEYRGNIFASQHGSWNRLVRSGYEVVRVPLKNGKSDGTYEDFLTGFLTPNGDVWGRPVGVATAPDGSLLVSDDGSGSIWRVTYAGR
jgi:glucose/arabinose dehydrogenase